MLGILAKPTEQRQQQRRASVGQHTIVSAEAKLGLLPMCADPLGEAFDSVQMGMQKFKIRLTRDEHHAQSANLLIRKMYSWRGYTTAAAPVATTTFTAAPAVHIKTARPHFDLRLHCTRRKESQFEIDLDASIASMTSADSS